MFQRDAIFDKVTFKRGHRGGAGDASPHQTKRGVDTTLDFIANHRQKYFCTAHQKLTCVNN